MIWTLTYHKYNLMIVRCITVRQLGGLLLFTLYKYKFGLAVVYFIKHFVDLLSNVAFHTCRLKFCFVIFNFFVILSTSIEINFSNWNVDIPVGVWCPYVGVCTEYRVSFTVLYFTSNPLESNTLLSFYDPLQISSCHK